MSIFGDIGSWMNSETKPKHGKFKVPGSPELDPNMYQLGQDPNWLANFSQRNAGTHADAGKMLGYGQELTGAARAAQGRATPGTNFGRSQAFGGQQVGAANWLQDFAQGPQGPSAAQAQLQEGANQSMQQSLALARAGGGFGESANSLGEAQRANANTMAAAANDAAQLRATEDQAFRQQQLGAMGTAADIFGATAEREGGQSQFLTDAELQAQAQRDAQELGLGAQSIEAMDRGIQGQLGTAGVDLDAANAGMQGQIARGDQALQQYELNLERWKERLRRDEAMREARRADRGEVLGGVGQVAGSIVGMMSDRRSKRRVRNVSADLDDTYAALEGRD
jgi:hypothetical protein